MSEIARLKARKEALFTNFGSAQRSLVGSIEDTPAASIAQSNGLSAHQSIGHPSVERQSQETAARLLTCEKALDMSIVTEDQELPSELQSEAPEEIDDAAIEQT